MFLARGRVYMELFFPPMERSFFFGIRARDTAGITRVTVGIGVLAITLGLQTPYITQYRREAEVTPLEKINTTECDEPRDEAR